MGQGISSDGIDLLVPELPSIGTRGVNNNLAHYIHIAI